MLEDGSGRVSLGIGAALVAGEVVSGVTVGCRAFPHFIMLGRSLFRYMSDKYTVPLELQMAVRGRVSSEEGSLGIFKVSAVLCCRPTSNLGICHGTLSLSVCFSSSSSQCCC